MYDKILYFINFMRIAEYSTQAYLVLEGNRIQYTAEIQ